MNSSILEPESVARGTTEVGETSDTIAGSSIHDRQSWFQLLGGQFHSRWVWFRAKTSSILQRWGWRVSLRQNVPRSQTKQNKKFSLRHQRAWLGTMDLYLCGEEIHNLRAGSWIWDSTVLQPMAACWVIALTAVVWQPVAFLLGHWEAVGSLSSRTGRREQPATLLVWASRFGSFARTREPIQQAMLLGEARFQALAKGQSLLRKASRGNFYSLRPEIGIVTSKICIEIQCILHDDYVLIW